jgi:hypothetical protein
MLVCTGNIPFTIGKEAGGFLRKKGFESHPAAAFYLFLKVWAFILS